MEIFEKLGFIILPLLITAFLYSIITRKQKEREKFNDAAAAFRNKVLNALEGIYPITCSWWDESLFPKFQQSVSIIETAGAEFLHFIKYKTMFNAAIKDYREYCQRRTYQGGAPHMTYKNMPNGTKQKPDPIEEFENIVEHLFSFAKNK
jgi:hypothetical protein